MSNSGPLSQIVVQYQNTVRELVPTISGPDDWAPLGKLIDTEVFERVGTFLEVQDWKQYTEMLTGWAQSVDSFDTTLLRVTEQAPLVYFEIEERHHFGELTHTVNSMTVFEFGDNDMIRRVNVYLQQPAPQ